MSQLSVEGFLFFVFWGSALLVVVSTVLALLERRDDV
jgi:hypothetical protein